jgi:electron transfer flavoprotein alpha subunit
MSAPAKILALVDLPGGELDETGRGIVSYAARLSVFADAAWGAVTLAEPQGDALAGLAAFGVPAVTAIDDGEALLNTPAGLGNILARLIADESASILVLPHNDLGATLAPLIAAALNAALLTEVTTVRRKDGRLHLSRSVLGSRIAETKVWDGQQPLVMTVPLRSLSQVLLPSVRPGNPAVATWRSAERPEVASFTIINRIPPDPQTVDLTEAEVIFSAGKGCDPATFEQLKELCRILNVSFGVTRPVYDLGWTGFERMVGQTGRTVTPRLYVALGISGSMHHVGGIKDSKRIISINNDPKAPIFPNSDEGFVADLGQVVPRLLERARASQGGAA